MRTIHEPAATAGSLDDFRILTEDRKARFHMRAVDLHVHSNRSDGTFTPSELVDYAMEKDLAAFALTDHDTVDGLDEAISYAEKLRQEQGSVHQEELPPESGSSENAAKQVHPVPEVIPGIEFSTEYQGQDVHIVGLYIDHHNGAFAAQLQAFVDSREGRNRKMCRLLTEGGIPVSYESLLEEFPNAVITRAHYAKYMLNHGYIKSMKEAFERYVGDNCPYYVPREKVTPVQAVSLVLQAGGIPILAHPILYHMSDARLDTLVSELKGAGLMGLEAIYSTYKAYEERQMRELAAKYDLLISGGSDFHGGNKPGLDLKTGYGKLFVPYEVLENIKKCRRKH